jgi:hypothetical protein
MKPRKVLTSRSRHEIVEIGAGNDDAHAHLQKRAPEIGALSHRSWGKWRRNLRAYERTRLH